MLAEECVLVDCSAIVAHAAFQSHGGFVLTLSSFHCTHARMHADVTGGWGWGGSFPLATKEFTALLEKHPRDWVVSFLLQWLTGRMESVVEASHSGQGSGAGGRGFAIRTSFHSNRVTHEECVLVLDQARRVLAVTSRLYNASTVCSP